MRTLVVGDTHGAYDALQQVLKAAAYAPATDQLVVLGDTLDGWSEGPAILDYYLSIQAAGHNLVYVLGNHDIAFLDWVDDDCNEHPLARYGGKVTVAAYTTVHAADVERHYEWLKAQHAYYIDEANRCYVHAGWNTAYAFNDPIQLTQQEYWWNRTFWQGMWEGGNLGAQFTEVFIGHTPTLNFEPYADKPLTRRNVHNLDTGAAFSGCVTVMDVQTKEFWQSQKCQDLYPLERGRNRR
jgi:serine/threonine protein phosphatase 1